MSSQDIIDIESERAKHSLKALGVDVDSIYGEMSSLEIALDLSITPDVMYINNKMVSVREASLRAQRLYLRIQRAMGDSQSWLLNLETSFDILSSSKMEFDAEVRAGQSIDDRKAIVNNKLVGYKRAIKEAKNNVSLLKSLNKAIDLCIKNIDRSDADVKQQARLMEAQMRNLKSTDVSAALRDSNLRRTEKDMEEVDKLFEDSLKGSTAAVTVGTEDSAEPVVAADLDVVSGFFDGPESDAPATEVVDEPTAEPEAPAGDAPAHEEAPDTDVVLDEASWDDDCVTLAPGLTGAPSATDEQEAEVTVMEGSDEPAPPAESAHDTDLLSVLDGIPSTDKRGLSMREDGTQSDIDDCFGLDLGDLDAETDVPDSVVVSAEDDDVFGGMVLSSVATEQKVPKIIRESAGYTGSQKPAPAAATALPKTAAPRKSTTKAESATATAAATATATATAAVTAAPAAKPITSTEDELSLDDLLNDLGV